LAHTLVGEHLAACVNIIAKVSSVYFWEGEVTSDGESLLIIKTAPDRVADLRERLVAAHPYSVPEVIALPIVDGHPAYLDWILESTRPTQQGDC
jgi:periplasmic divalent cation tolerance protein